MARLFFIFESRRASDEHAAPGLLDRRDREARFGPGEAGEIGDPVEQFAWIAGQQRAPGLRVQPLDQVVDRGVLDIDAAQTALATQQGAVGSRRPGADVDLVADAAQRGIVEHAGRDQVGANTTAASKGTVPPGRLAATAGRCRIQRTGETVQQLGGRDALAADVVDHQHAVVRLQVRRRVVHTLLAS
jgi:uncharacterized protein YdbL (DUF1318 family)